MQKNAWMEPYKYKAAVLFIKYDKSNQSYASAYERIQVESVATSAHISCNNCS